MAIAYASSTLTLTGGTSGARLTPANIINDATAFSTASNYAVGAIMKHNAGGGLGTALYRCSTAVTVAGAFNAGNWTLLAYINGSTLTVIAAVLEIGAFYDDTRWFYDFINSGYVRTANGCNWTSGNFVNGIYTSGFKCSNASGGNVFVGGQSSDRIFWYNVAFNKKNGAVLFNNPNLGGLFYNLYVDATASFGDNSSLDCPNIVGTNFTYLFANFYINPENKTGLTHYGLYEGNMVDNKIRVLTNALTTSVSSGNKYIVGTLGTATLANWQAFFSYLTAIPKLGDVITATATGTLAGSANVKIYKPLAKYTPAIPSDNSKGIGLIGNDSFQFFEDLVVPVGFNFATQIKAYYGGTSAYFTRLVNIVTKQGANILAGVKVRVVNTSDSSQLSIENTNGSGTISKQMLIYSGERIGGGSYVALQNPKDYRNKSFLFRRKDLVEAVYTTDMTISSVELTQFMSTDSYYTADQSANLADVSFVTSGNNITGVAINALMTLDRLYDITKAYLEANLNITNPFTANGKTFDFGSIAITDLEKISAGTKLNALQSTGTINAIGAFAIEVIGAVSQATPTNLPATAKATTLTYNTNMPATVSYATGVVIGTLSNDGTAIVSASGGSVTTYTDAEINFLDSNLSAVGITSVTIYGSQSDRDTGANAGATFTTSLDFKYGSVVSGVTMQNTVYLRVVVGSMTLFAQITLVTGSNVLDLGVQGQLSAINAKVDLTAKETTLLQTETDIIAEINANETKIDTLQTSVDNLPTLSEIEASTELAKESSVQLAIAVSV